jgi:hypothetical protein
VKQDAYFVRHHSDSPYKYSEVNIKGMSIWVKYSWAGRKTVIIIKGMLGFLVENIYVVFGGHVFKQSVDIPMGTNCAHLLTNLFLY